jgi:Tfp pilus assembly protein PilN
VQPDSRPHRGWRGALVLVAAAAVRATRRRYRARPAGAGALQSIIREVNVFEQQRAALQQRVALIEQLRGGQSIPVQLLDVVSKSVPDMLWLTDLEQKGSDVTIQGQSTTLISLSDFVNNLGRHLAPAEAD